MENMGNNGMEHDDSMAWKHFRHYRPFVREIHQSLVESPHKRGSYTDLWIFLSCKLNQAVEQTAKYRIMWNTITLIWHHCNEKRAWWPTPLFLCLASQKLQWRQCQLQQNMQSHISAGELILDAHADPECAIVISMGYSKKDVTPQLTHWSYIFLTLIQGYIHATLTWSSLCQWMS